MKIYVTLPTNERIIVELGLTDRMTDVAENVAISYGFRLFEVKYGWC